MTVVLIVGLTAVGMPAVAGASSQAPIRLAEGAADAGIQFMHRRGARGERHPVETMGSGVAVLDYDGDGRADVFFAQGGEVPGLGRPAGPPGALYRNLGGRRFADVTEASGFGEPPATEGFGMGAVAADYDDDGDPDLLLTRAGTDLLYENRGDGTFRERDAGLDAAGWSAGAAFADLDRDGDLDLYVTRYLDWSPENNPECARNVDGERIRSYCLPDAFRGVPDLLHENLGDRTFADVSRESGVALPGGKGLGVVAADLAGDPLPDLYVANDTTPNFLFENLGGMTFREIGLASGTAYDGDGNALAGMGVALGDVEPDGDPDLFVTNFQGEANTLYATRRRGAFSDRSFASGLGRASLDRLGFGAMFADLDSDGLPDLCVANGHVLDNATRLFADASYRQPDECFRNVGGGVFAPVAPFSPRGVGRGLASADFDRDGRLDLAASRSGEPAALFWNETAAGGGIAPRAVLRLVGDPANRDAVGAEARVRGSSGVIRLGTTGAGGSYLSSSERTVWIGLGAGPPESVSIRWPDAAGTEETVAVTGPGIIILKQGVGVVRRVPDERKDGECG